jgi:hypothetical protein
MKEIKIKIRIGGFFLAIFIFLAGITFGNSGKSGDKIVESNFSDENKEKIFVIQAPVTDLNEFREIAKQAVRLKPFGKVEINISELADKGFHEIPDGRNFWYEYASYNPTPYKFFPDPNCPLYSCRICEEKPRIIAGKGQNFTRV